MDGQRKLLVSWYTDPRYIAPFVLSDAQITVGPKLRADQPRLMYAATTPVGTYDLEAALKAQGITTDFDLIVVWADASGTNHPLNLDAFDCPKVLCVGDTHHLQAPLQKMTSYAADGRFDFVVSSHNRHHLHWFAAAGFGNVAWLPGLKVRHIPRPFPGSRTPGVCFVGQAGRFHPRRIRLLHALKQAAVPLIVTTADRDTAADRYASSVVSFNASLNGDLNLRVFEVLSAGGCLLTDRLAPQAGLDLLLEEDKEFIAYDSAEELIEKARFLLQNPQSALKIAGAGNRAFTEGMLPKTRTDALLGWVFDGRLDDVFRADRDSRRLESAASIKLETRLGVYEALQQLHLEKETPRVLFASDVPNIYLSDAADLRRLNPKIAAFEPDDLTGRSEAPKPLCDLSEARAIAWDCVVMPAGRRPPTGLRYAQLLPV
jgi:hypothetical protein